MQWVFLVFHPICVCNCKHKQPPRDCLHLDIFCIDPRLLSNRDELPMVKKVFHKYYVSFNSCNLFSFLCMKLQKCGSPTSEASSLKGLRGPLVETKSPKWSIRMWSFVLPVFQLSFSIFCLKSRRCTCQLSSSVMWKHEPHRILNDLNAAM